MLMAISNHLSKKHQNKLGNWSKLKWTVVCQAFFPCSLPEKNGVYTFREILLTLFIFGQNLRM